MLPAQRRMYQKHEVRVSQFPGDLETILRFHVLGKRLFQINLGAAAGKAWDTFGDDGLKDPVPGPSAPE